MLPLLLVILFCILGVITGIATGLLPGLHVNNIALILLSLSGAIVSGFSFLFEYGISEQFILILICIYIISTSISHTFHDVIPSTWCYFVLFYSSISDSFYYWKPLIFL